MDKICLMILFFIGSASAVRPWIEEERAVDWLLVRPLQSAISWYMTLGMDYDDVKDSSDSAFDSDSDDESDS